MWKLEAETGGVVEVEGGSRGASMFQTSWMEMQTGRMLMGIRGDRWSGGAIHSDGEGG